MHGEVSEHEQYLKYTRLRTANNMIAKCRLTRYFLGILYSLWQKVIGQLKATFQRTAWEHTTALQSGVGLGTRHARCEGAQSTTERGSARARNGDGPKCKHVRLMARQLEPTWKRMRNSKTSCGVAESAFCC